MSTCLLPEKVDDFKKALKDKSISLADLVNLDHDKLVEKLTPYAGDKADAVATTIEEKLILKNRTLGLQNALNKMTASGKFTPERIAENKRILSDFKAKQQERIFSPSEHQSYLGGIVEKKLGFSASKEVAAKVGELSRKVTEAEKVPTKNLSGVSDEYLKAAGELQSYVNSQKPISAAASIGKNAAIIARNNLLLNPSTPLKTSVGQVVNSVMDFFTRRIGTLSLGGLNYDLVRTANSEAWKTYRETGLDTAAMESLQDTGKLGEGTRFNVSGDTTSKPGFMGGIREVGSAIASGNPKKIVETGVRRLAGASNKVAIDWEHNIAFTKFYQKAFFDMANVFSSNIAKSEGLKGTEAQTRAAEIFKDASRIKPETEAGAMVRLESQHQAARVTSTNDTYIGRLALGVKDALNKTVGGLGDALMPIAKIPSNIIWNGIENAGVGIPLGVKDIFQGRVKMQSEDLTTRYQGMAQYANGIQKVARTVGVLGAAAYFSSQLTKQDFKTDRYGGSFVKIGNTWVNMEYINAISPALAGMMEVKKTGKPGQGALNTTGQYVAGSLGGLKNAPGVNELNQLVTAITNADYAKGISKYAKTFFTSRGEPAFIRQLQNGNTPIKNLFFSTSGLPTPEELKKLGAK